MNLLEYSRTKCKDTPSLETSFADKTSLSRSTQNDENLPDWPDRELHSTRYWRKFLQSWLFSTRQLTLG